MTGTDFSRTTEHVGKSGIDTSFFSQARAIRLGAEDTAAGNPQRLLMVTPRFFPSMGGVENHVYQVSRRFARQGIDTTVLTTDDTGRLPTLENLDGVTIRRVRAWPPKQDYSFSLNLYRIITQEQWEIVHVQSYHTLVAPLAMLAAWQAGVPYIVTFHGGGHSSRLRHSLRVIQQWLLRPLLAHAERLVAVAPFEIPMYSKRLGLPRNKFTLIPTGADLPNIPREEREAVDENLIVSIGRLERYKGHQRAIAALPEILARRPNMRLWIAGDGPYKSELWDLAHRLGVQDRVDIHAIPGTERGRMARELSKAALVLLLSEYETYPVAVFEALTLGRPVLVADAPGLRELAERGLAQAIPLKSKPSQVAEAVIQNLNQPINVMNLKIPTWEDCCDGLLALYRDVTGRTFCGS